MEEERLEPEEGWGAPQPLQFWIFVDGYVFDLSLFYFLTGRSRAKGHQFGQRPHFFRRRKTMVWKKEG